MKIVLRGPKNFPSNLKKGKNEIIQSSHSKDNREQGTGNPEFRNGGFCKIKIHST